MTILQEALIGSFGALFLLWLACMLPVGLWAMLRRFIEE